MTQIEIGQHPEFTMENLVQWAYANLPDTPDQDRMQQLIETAISWILPDDARWNPGDGTITWPDPDAGMALYMRGLAYVIIGAVTSDAWARPRSVPGKVFNEDGSPRIILGWDPFESDV